MGERVVYYVEYLARQGWTRFSHAFDTQAAAVSLAKAHSSADCRFRVVEVTTVTTEREVPSHE